MQISIKNFLKRIEKMKYPVSDFYNEEAEMKILVRYLTETKIDGEVVPNKTTCFVDEIQETYCYKTNRKMIYLKEGQGYNQFFCSDKEPENGETVLREFEVLNVKYD